MLEHNYLLQEAVDKMFNPAPSVSAFKKAMNTCKLAKFRSQSANELMYSSFFLCQTEDPLTFDQWRQVYTLLLNDDTFCNNMVLFIALYHPITYEGMFRVLTNLVDSELRELHTNQIRYLSDAKAFFQYMQTRFDSIGTTVKTQTTDNDTIQFLVTINGVLTTNLFYMNKLIDRAVADSYDPDDITHEIRGTIEEDAREILNLLEHGEQWQQDWINQNCPMNEGIVNKAKETAKKAYVASQHASRAFDELIMKKVKQAREKRRNKKHAEMVGEALRINDELKRLLRSLGIGLFSPALGVITWVISVVIDRATDKKDRDILVGQLKDEMEIVEEKISIAERNGDDKGKIELMRIRQKLRREYERIQGYRFDADRMNR